MTPNDPTRPAATFGSLGTAWTGSIAVQVFSAASNANGAVVWEATIRAPANQTNTFLAKATAPATVLDGTLIRGEREGGGTLGGQELPRPRFIPAGLGLF